MLAASNPPLFLGILGAAVLVIGLIAVIVLAIYVIKRAPKDGSDVGRDPHLNADEHGRQNGRGTRSTRR